MPSMSSGLSVRLLSVLAFLSSLAGASQAQGYCLRTFQNAPGYPAWGTSQVPYYVSDAITDQKVSAAIDAAFAGWSAVSCASLSFQKAGTFSTASTSFDEHGDGIYVFWYAAPTGWPSTSVDAPALSLMMLDGSGAIVQGSIAVNGFKYAWATNGNSQAFDVQGQLTNLVGQASGLGTSNTTNSVMTSTLKYGDTSKRSLTADDQAAVQYLYPQPGCTLPPAPDASGCATVGSSTSPPPSGSNPPPPSGGNTPPPPQGGGGTPAAGCAASTDCASNEVCTAEGTCVVSDGQGSAGSCTSYIECLGGEVCTAEGTCVAVGSSGPTDPAQTDPGPQTPPAQPADPPSQPLSGTGCASSSECSSGEICTAEGVCLPASVDGGSGGGCSASAAKSPSTLPYLLLMVGLLALLYRRAT